MHKLSAVIAACALITGLAAAAIATDDPSIKGDLRAGIKQAMVEHVAATTVDGDYLIYDAVTDDLLRLRFDGLHEGIVTKSDFYVSCADFADEATDTYYDLDFLVAEVNGGLRVLQAVVHKRDDETRKYHLED